MTAPQQLLYLKANTNKELTGDTLPNISHRDLIYYQSYLFLSVQCYAMHGQNIDLPVCVSVCPSHCLSTRLQVRPLNGFLHLIA